MSSNQRELLNVKNEVGYDIMVFDNYITKICSYIECKKMIGFVLQIYWN